MLTSEQIEGFYAEGYLVLEDFVSRVSCQSLMCAAEDLVANFALDATTQSVFSTRAPRHERDRYFLDSGSEVRFFLEEEACDENGHLTVAKAQAINKIGHALHELHPDFRTFSKAPALRELIAELGYLKKPRTVQSMYLFKQPYIGGEVVCHQDSTFIHTAPDRLLGAWFALEDATKENGCLWGIPGHYDGPPKRLFIREGDACHFEERDESPWPEAELRPLEVGQGSLILFHGFFPHLSYANRSDRSRHAFSLHLVDATADYLPSNWLRPGHGADCG